MVEITEEMVSRAHDILSQGAIVPPSIDKAAQALEAVAPLLKAAVLGPEPMMKLHSSGGTGFPMRWFSERMARRNHNQSLETLNRRGGLAAMEMWCNIHGKHWHERPKGLNEAAATEYLHQRLLREQRAIDVDAIRAQARDAALEEAAQVAEKAVNGIVLAGDASDGAAYVRNRIRALKGGDRG